MISATEDGFDYSKSSKINLTEGYTGEHYLVLAFTDNSDAADSDYIITFGDEGNSNNSWKGIEAIDSSALDSVRSHDDIDYPMAIKVPDGLLAGTHTIVIQITEDGDPWENTRTVELKLTIKELVLTE
jgi:hypothetical protein